MLTLNEERHIRRALENSFRFAKEVFVVDSYSTDRTTEIAKEMGAKVVQHAWENYSKQFAWALEHLPITTEWVYRQDADEYLTDELIAEIDLVLPTNDGTVNGYVTPYLRKFMGRYIAHGIVPLFVIRLFRYQHAKIENKLMDEHMVLTDGKEGRLTHPMFDDSLMSLTEWTQKHNGYATREALDLLATEFNLGLDNEVTQGLNAHTASVRAKKLKYQKMPLFWRAFALFFYRYILRGGFLDGKEGFLWHFLQGFWYRTLADAKVYEIKKQYGFDETRIRAYLHSVINV